MKVVLATGRRKTALARATVKDGQGRVFINRRALEVVGGFKMKGSIVRIRRKS